MPLPPPPPAQQGTLRGAVIARRFAPTSLRLFRAAVEEWSLAAVAAEREAIALSAASRHIAELEDCPGGWS